jgi:hypothetical protein
MVPDTLIIPGDDFLSGGRDDTAIVTILRKAA